MPVGKGTMKWKNAMAVARRNYPKASLSRKRRIAGAIIGGKKK